MDKNYKYRKNQCQCGKEKDKRSELCNECRAALNVNLQKEKICNGCSLLYPIDEYNIRINKQGKPTRQSQCKKCRAAYTRKRTQEHPEKVKESNRLYALKRPDRIKMWSIRSRWKKQGYNPNEIEKFILEHKGGCEICGETKKLVLDHNHETGALRGMLCPECNFGLGKFKDNKNLLNKAINYLSSELPQGRGFQPNRNASKY